MTCQAVANDVIDLKSAFFPAIETDQKQLKATKKFSETIVRKVQITH